MDLLLCCLLCRADWRLFLTVEERQLIRKKISSAYENRTQTYEELLQVRMNECGVGVGRCDLRGIIEVKN